MKLQDKIGKKIVIGYLKDLPESDFISSRVIEHNFLDLLSRDSDIKIIPISNDRHIEEGFKGIERYDLDYLYIGSLSDRPFLLREKIGMDIPFIFYIHTVYPWFWNFVYVMPFLRKSDKILAPSQYAKDLFLKLSSKFDVHVVPYCVDSNLIHGDLFTDQRKNKKIITFMGRLKKEKGIEVLIESLPKIMAKINNVHLNIIGPLSGNKIKDSPKSSYVKKIEKLVRQHKLTDRVTFKGVQLGLNKYKILAGSNVFVNPTLAKEETFGMANIETLACGVPVITTDWAANREIVENDKNGYLLDVHRDKKNKPYFDHNQLVFLIIKVLGDKNLNSILKKNAMISAEKYGHHRVMPYLVSLLEKRRVRRGITGRWDFFKDKTASDFRHLFNNEFLFFIFFYREFKTYTFASLYNRAINNLGGKNNTPRISVEKNAKRKNPKSSILEKIRSDLLFYLTSTEKSNT